MVDVPAMIDLTEWSTPQVRLRRWAGEHGEKHGLTHFTKNDMKGRPEYAETPEQNAFRHAFVAAAKYLENREIADHDPFGASAGREDEIAASNVIRLGFLNEWYGANSLGHHLQDYWNNYEGVNLGREVADQFGTDISNDALAEYIAGKTKSSPERFIFDRENDPRIINRDLYETERLPRGSYGDFFVPDPLISAFPDLYGDQ